MLFHRLASLGIGLAACVLAGGCLSAAKRSADEFKARESEASPEEIRRKASGADEAYGKEPRSVESVQRSLDLALESVSSANAYQGLWQAARAHAWLAEHHPNEEERELSARRGVALAREAVRLAPDRVEPHYYLALNQGRLSSLLKTPRYIDEMAKSAQTALEKDEKFDRAGPHRFLGILHLRTEGKLLVGFGDLDKALDHLKRAVELAPNDFENRLAYGEALIADEEYDDARRELAAAAALKPPSDEPAEEWRRRLDEVRGKLKS